MANPNLIPAPPATRDELERAAERAGRDWRMLWLRIRTISPRSLMRTTLVFLGLGAVLWLILRAGSDLMPFWIGLVIAYITAPLVKALDSFLPRTIAVLLVLLLELVIILAFLAIVVPTLAREATSILQSIPSREVLRGRVDQAMISLKALPLPVQDFVKGWLDTAYENLQTNFGLYVRQGLRWGVQSMLGLMQSLTFLLGFLVIPQWLVAVLASRDRGRRAVDSLLADWLRPDFWATVGIVDRTFAVYVRGRFVVAAMVGAMTWVGLMLFPYLGLEPLPYINALALIAFMLNLIPVIGPVLAAIPPLVLALSLSWEEMFVVLAVVIGAQIVKSIFVQPRVENKAVDIHPAILALIIVLASQFGIVWAILAGPVAVAARDLFRYAYGRFSVPSRPAGVLPGASVYTRQPAPVPAPIAAPAAAPMAPPASQPALADRAMGD